jgi:hypothetical protein
MPRNTQTSLHSLWRIALTRPLHNVSCGCFLPSAIKIDALSLELDLIDYVELKHSLGQVSKWSEALKNREGMRESSFPDWIFSLRGECLSWDLHDFVMADITKTLNSMVEHSVRRLAPVNSLTQGWLGNTSFT